MLQDGQLRLAARISAISQKPMLLSCVACETQGPLLLEKQILTNSQPASLVLVLLTESCRTAFGRNTFAAAPVLDPHLSLREGSYHLPWEQTLLAQGVSPPE